MSVRAYSRHEFRAWLSGLPQDEPFCRDCRCPIAEFMRCSGWIDWLDFDNAAAHNLDTRLAVTIDKHCRERPDFLPGFDQWSSLTPRECIALIDELQERAA